MWIINGGTPSISLRVAGILLSFSLAIFTYKYIEPPFRFGSHSKVKASILVVLMLVIGFTGVIIYKYSGFPNRTSMQEHLKNQKLLIHDVSSHNKENCSSSTKYPYANFNKDFFCMESSPDNALISSAIIGDSHAYPMYFGFYDYLVGQKNEKLILLGAPGCPSFLDIESFELGESDSCRRLMNTILERVVADSSIQSVILVNRAPLYITRVGIGEVDVHNRVLKRVSVKTPESNAIAYKLALESTIKYLVQHGKKIIFVFPPPELGFEPSSCLGTRPFSWKGESISSCGVPYQSYLLRVNESKKIVMEVIGSYEAVTFIEPADTLCDFQNCYVSKEDQFMYLDNNHLSPAGAKLVINKFKGLN
jgi:hypothetical protein